MSYLQSRVKVIAVSTTLLSESKTRAGVLIIENKDGANPVEVTFGEQDAVVGEGIKILFGERVIIEHPRNGQINAIATGGNVNVMITD